jgi:hypothetical protein
MPSHVPHEIIDGVELKRCTECKEYKPLTEYIKSRANKDGLNIYCNDCRKAKKQAEYEKHRDKYLERFSKYYYENLEEAKEQGKKYREQNKDSINARAKIYREANKERIAKWFKGYRERNREYLKAYDAARQSDPERKTKHNAACRKYYATEKGNLNAQLSRERYRNRQSGVSNTLTRSQWNTCKQIFNYTCAYCGKSLNNLTQDHFIPLSKGGGYDVDNIIPCCKPCNSSKQDKDFAEWYSKQPYYSEKRKNKINKYLALFK